MRRNINGFRLNKNGKPILFEVGEVLVKEYRGSYYKEEGIYFFYRREFRGEFIYSN